MSSAEPPNGLQGSRVKEAESFLRNVLVSMKSVCPSRNPTAKSVLGLVRSVHHDTICCDHIAFRTFGRAEDRGDSFEKIKRQLASGSGRNSLQGPLLKRSETLKKWNERWVILDPKAGKIEYK